MTFQLLHLQLLHIRPWIIYDLTVWHCKYFMHASLSYPWINFIGANSVKFFLGPWGLSALTSLFLIFINDISNKISSTIQLAVIVYRCMKSFDDIYNENLDMLSEWAATWSMTFNLNTLLLPTNYPLLTLFTKINYD